MSSQNNKRKMPSSETAPCINKKISDMLLELADYEKNVTRQHHKYNVYRKAANALAKHEIEIKTGKDAEQLPGVGKKIGLKIDEFIASGKLNKLEKIRASDTNVAIQQLVRVSGIGPAFAKQLVEDGIMSLNDLRAQPDKLRTAHQKIGLRFVEDFEKRIPRAEMKLLERTVRDELNKLDAKYEMTVCGSYRRGADTSGDIDCLLTDSDFNTSDHSSNKAKGGKYLSKAVDALKKLGFVTDVISLGDCKFMGVCHVMQSEGHVMQSKGHVMQSESHVMQSEGHVMQSEGHVMQSEEQVQSDITESETVRPKPGHKIIHRRIDIQFGFEIVPKDQFACSVLYFTGSDEFNRQMRTEALKLGYTLNEHSLRKMGTSGFLYRVKFWSVHGRVAGEPIPVESERDVFDYLNMDFREPIDRRF